jgi:hypothetical protein
MKITHPFNNDIVLVKNFFSNKDLTIINNAVKNLDSDCWLQNDFFLDKGAVKNFSGKTVTVNVFDNKILVETLNKYTIKAESIIQKYYKNFRLNYDVYSITKTTGRGMDSHSDNNGENKVIAGCVFYFNSNFTGGELVYDKLNISYFPEPGDFIFHPATNEYEHHVKDVASGARYSIGFSAYSTL